MGDGGGQTITQQSITEWPQWAQDVAKYGLGSASNLAKTQTNPVASSPNAFSQFNQSIAPGVRQTEWFNPSNYAYDPTQELTGRQGGQFSVDRFGNRINPLDTTPWQADPLGQVWVNNKISGWVDPTNQVRHGLLPNTFDPLSTGSVVGQKLLGQGGMQFTTNDWGMKINPQTGELDPGWRTDPFGNVFVDGMYKGTVDSMGRINPLLVNNQQYQAPQAVSTSQQQTFTPQQQSQLDTSRQKLDQLVQKGFGNTPAAQKLRNEISSLSAQAAQPTGTTGTVGGVTPTGQSNYYNINPSASVAPINAWQKEAMDMLTQRAQGGLSGDPMVDAATSALTDTLSGKYLNLDTNPMWDPYSQRIQEAYQYGVAPQMNAAFANAEAFGPSNSGWVQQSMLDARNKLGDPLALLGADIYKTERNLQNQAASLVPGIQAAGFVPGQVMGGVGDAMNAYSQRLIDATMNSQLDAANYPWSQLYNLASVGMPFAGTSTTNTGPNPYVSSPLAGALGGGMLGYGLSQIGPVAGAVGGAAPYLLPILGALGGYALSS